MALAFTLSGCAFTDVGRVPDYLALSRRVGRSSVGPTPLPVRINVDNDWERLVNAINWASIPVRLNLSNSNMTNTEFDPGNNGSRYIVSIVLPNSVTGITRGFGIFPNISTIRFPASVDLDEVNPFVGLSQVTFNLRGSGDLDVIENGRALVRGGSELVSFPSASGNVTLNNITIIARSALNGTAVESINFPAVTAVGMFAFGNCANLTTVNLPTAEFIEYGAFINNTSLQNINLPAAVSIGANVFLGNTSLQTVELPAVTSIGAHAFQGNTSLRAVNIPAAVSLGHRAFANTGTQALAITVNQWPSYIGTQMFFGVGAAKAVTVRVPQDAIGNITPAMNNAVRGRGWQNGTFILPFQTGSSWNPVFQFNTNINLSFQGQ